MLLLLCPTARPLGCTCDHGPKPSATTASSLTKPLRRLGGKNSQSDTNRQNCQKMRKAGIGSALAQPGRAIDGGGGQTYARATSGSPSG